MQPRHARADMKKHKGKVHKGTVHKGTSASLICFQQVAYLMFLSNPVVLTIAKNAMHHMKLKRS